MKKLGALALCLALVVGMVPAALAAGTAQLGLSAERTDGVTTVTVRLRGDAGATNGRVQVSYDPALVTMTDCQPGEQNWAVTSLDDGLVPALDENGQPVINEDHTDYVYEESGVVSFAWVGSDLPADAVVLTLTFADVEQEEPVQSVTYSAACVELYAEGAEGPEAMTVSPSEAETTVSYVSTPSIRPGTSTGTGTGTGTGDQPTEPSFVDISEHWAEADIEKLHDAGLVEGTGDGTTFEPETDLSRAMFATILHRAKGAPEAAGSASFTDVAADSWYSAAVDWASEAGVTTGTGDGTTFSPDQIITREQLMTMLYRYAELEGRDVSARAELGDFTDAADVSDWALEAMRWAVAEGIIQGNGAKALMPRDNATRAQMAAILVRFLDL